MAGVSIDVEVLTGDKEEKEIRLPECWICNDTGIVLYRKKTKEGEYEYVAHCTCQAGLPYHYNGMECKKEKSPYYIPSIAEVADPAMIAKDNIVDFYMRHKDDEQVMKALEERGIMKPREVQQ